MILRLSSPAPRLVLLLTAMVLAPALSFFGFRNARAIHDADLGTLQGYQKAIQLEPRNAQNWYLLGRYWQYNLYDPDAQRAIGAFKTSLSINPRSADTWLDLASIYELADDPSSARNAYLQAQKVYPASAEVSWRYGNFLLRQGEFPQAFAEIRRAVYADPKRGGEAFSRCWRVDPDIQTILNNVLPPHRDAYIEVLHELTVQANADAALAVWPRLVAIHPRLFLYDVLGLTDMLIGHQHPADARRVWDDAVRLSGSPAPLGPPGSVVWDGSFETGFRGGAFAWLFSPSGGVQAIFDTKEKHSGNQSLRLTFDGKHNVNSSIVCTIAAVQPGTPYQLSAWLRPQALTTDQGVRVQLSWSQNSKTQTLATPDAQGTQPWTRVETQWTPPSDVQAAQICVVRYASDKFESRIQGTAWIDDVALVPQSAEKPNP
jgi:hypothetical protein